MSAKPAALYNLLHNTQARAHCSEQVQIMNTVQYLSATAGIVLQVQVNFLNTYLYCCKQKASQLPLCSHMDLI